MNKYEWLESTINEDTIAEVAQKSGIIKTTAWRQYNNDLGFSAENVILIARAYHKDPVEALVAFDYLRDDERGVAAVRSALHAATDKQLIDELASRLDRQPDKPIWNEPVVIEEHKPAPAPAVDPVARREQEKLDQTRRFLREGVGFAANMDEHKYEHEDDQTA
ncbi:hypothetical protein [Bifidobacterium aerophilum]|uniref:DNA-binding protein n=1 Tax=Bifidobacterium aerophilum TaxID=1798155 RepID=A0A6N9Z520_9BIFI|nr:hypothetical protein [Bifidobacterium aerophilum]NEG89797.1 hypothetical protein [Bifidobacterium aerophilum]